jgi:hypothetical protein
MVCSSSQKGRWPGETKNGEYGRNGVAADASSTTRGEGVREKGVGGVYTGCSIGSEKEPVEWGALRRGYYGQWFGGKEKCFMPSSQVLANGGRDGKMYGTLVGEGVVIILKRATKSLEKFTMLGEIVEEA